MNVIVPTVTGARPGAEARPYSRSGGNGNGQQVAYGNVGNDGYYGGSDSTGVTNPSNPLRPAGGNSNNDKVLSYLPDYQGKRTSSLITKQGGHIVIPSSYNAFLDIMLNSIRNGDTESSIGALRSAASQFHTNELLAIPVSTISNLGDTPNPQGLYASPAIGGKINKTAAAINKANATYDPFTDVGAGIVAVLQGIGMGEVLNGVSAERPDNSLITDTSIDQGKATALKEWIQKNPSTQQALQQFANVVKDIVKPSLEEQQSGPGLTEIGKTFSDLQPKVGGGGGQTNRS